MRRPHATFAAIAVASLTTAVLYVTTTGPANGATTGDEVAVARFSLVVDGAEIAAFAELASLSSAIDEVDYINSDGKSKTLTSKRPSIVLRRAMDSSDALWQWHAQVVARDQTARKSCSLIMYDTQGAPVARYNMTNAWPSKLDLHGLKDGPVYETVTIIADAVTRSRT